MLTIIFIKIWLLAKHAYFCNPCIIFISQLNNQKHKIKLWIFYETI